MSRPIRSERERGLAGEDGMTLVEILVAALIFVIGALAIFQSFGASGRSVYRAEQSQVLNSVVQRELEEVRRLPYAEVALQSPTPTPQAAENDPRHRVVGTQFALNRNGTSAAELVVSGGGLDTDGDGQADDGTINCGELVPGQRSGAVHVAATSTATSTASSSGGTTPTALPAAAEVRTSSGW